MQLNKTLVKKIQAPKNMAKNTEGNGMFLSMKKLVAHSGLISLLIFASINASASCQEKVAKLLGLPKTASVSISPLPSTDEYQDYFVSYMTSEKMGTMIARCFNDESKDAVAVVDENPGGNPALESDGTVKSETVTAPLPVKPALIGPPMPTAN
jgi:hypothetical protein